VECEKCTAMPPAPLAVTPTPLVDVPGAVLEYPGVVLDSADTHWIDPGCTLVRYRFKSTMIACSLPGRHQHGEGRIVRARCGLLLRMGHICAKKYVLGYKEAMRAEELQVELDVKREFERRAKQRAEEAESRALRERLEAKERLRRQRESWPSRVARLEEKRVSRRWCQSDLLAQMLRTGKYDEASVRAVEVDFMIREQREADRTFREALR
jgi:hypothetical protein